MGMKPDAVLSPQELHRLNAEHEARLDLTKNVQALLSDVHDESNKGDAVHANKRIAGLSAVLASQQVQAAEKLLTASNANLEILGEMKSLVESVKTESEKTQKRLDRLNRWMFALTFLGVLFAGASLWLAWESLQIQKQDNKKNETASPLAKDTKNSKQAPAYPKPPIADTVPVKPAPEIVKPSPEIPPAAPAP